MSWLSNSSNRACTAWAERKDGQPESAYLRIRLSTPCLNEDTRKDQRHRVLQMALQSCSQIVELDLFDQVLLQNPRSRVLDELEQQHATPVTRGYSEPGGSRLCRRVPVRATCHTDYPARGADALGEKTETALRATADLDDAPTATNIDLIKQPAGFMGKLARLPLQTILLRLPVTQNVRIRFAHF